MHEAVFEAGWKHQEMRSQHRRVLPWIGHFRIILEREKIFAAKQAYDYVNRTWSCYPNPETCGKLR